MALDFLVADCQILFMTQNVTDQAFEAEVLKSDLPVLVDFYATWCGPCQQLAPHVDALAAEQAGKLKVLKMNIDENPLTPSQYGIRSIPTVIYFQGGKAKTTKMGAMPKSALDEWINGELAGNA